MSHRLLRTFVKPALTLLAAVLFGVAGCGPRGEGLRGRRPYGPGAVGQVSATEVSVDGASRPFAFRAGPGRLLFVTFGYTSCPDICPTTMSDLARALRQLGPLADSVDVAFVTVDINRDSAAVLAPYVESFAQHAHGIRPRNQAELAPVEAAFGATSTVTKDARGEVHVSHTGSSYLVDDRGRVRVEWPFGTAAGDMAHDLRLLLGAGPR